MQRNLFLYWLGRLASLFLTTFLLLAAQLATAQATCGYYPLTTTQFATAANVAARTGTGGLCTFLTCSISDEANVTDASLTNSATISLNLVGATGAISSRVSSNTLPAGATAGYVIGSGALNLGVGTSIQITTYLDGVQKDQNTVASLVNLSLLSPGTAFVGIPTTQPFNEVRIQFNLLAGTQNYSVYYPLATYTGGATATNPTLAAANSGVISVSAGGENLLGNVLYTYALKNAANVTVGTTQTTSGLAAGTYTATVSSAVGCLFTKTIDLGATACGISPLTTNNFTGVTVNTATVGGDVRTGIYGVCVGCGVTNTANVIDANTTNTANINILAGVVSGGRISVLDTRRTYSAGLKAGFVLQDGGLLGTALFNGTKIRTFLGGVQQEEASVTGLLDLPLLTAGYSSIGFTTTKAFDEVQLDASSLVGALINVNVAYAFVQNGPVIGLVSQTNPTSASLANGAIDVNVTGGTVPYTYAWTGPVANGATTQDLTNLAAGVYSLSVSDAGTCGASRSFTLVAPGGGASLSLVNASLTITTGQNTSVNGSLVTQLNPTGGIGALVYVAVNCQTGLAVTATAQGGLVVVNPLTGLYVYTPASGFTGTDSFCVHVCDSTLPVAVCQTATVTVTVGSGNNCLVQAHVLTR
ncbi:Ig-like domain-containing protein [Fibrella aquatilis]|uniref:SprB repeat-containing protein n=1 Tax=Fibrella aquatilis TaxID=2817059 RepID=A0A939K0M1_9BACT|nr:Ig-like domain-containing protein [Fibrella aquatilis]MBO0932618.1 hypothetical protein [Fibrella aquatilis]